MKINIHLIKVVTQQGLSTNLEIKLTLSISVLTLWVAPPKMFYQLLVLIGFDGAETNCGIAHILGIQLMNSYGN